MNTNVRFLDIEKIIKNKKVQKTLSQQNYYSKKDKLIIDSDTLFMGRNSTLKNLCPNLGIICGMFFYLFL